jgi:hypothetical protein
MGVPIKVWTEGVPLEDAAQKEMLNLASLSSGSQVVVEKRSTAE